MNILIVSNNNFFISGAIALISKAWPTSVASGLVFMVSTDDRAPLEPDIIIRDVCIPPAVPASSANAPRQKLLSNRTTLTWVTLFFAKQCSEKHGTHCPLHYFYLEKSESANGLLTLFRRRHPALASHAVQHCGQRTLPLSKQQAMVVRYTREGMSLTDISRMTHLSVKTISTHKRAVMRKLGIKNNSEFYQFALAGYVQ
ncbi:LuxR C-terminal-related transcriptional regulator [Erwinia sp. 9145]|uniref:helix-turn-helix transcriptional regulator n=1 Tax=Erwinia sp. 9145 TaxID=1500895 RepID=UPI00054D0403|nr:LuxR C-terminal-related transcriptional regulator [Erwinia sp. 9145]